MDAKQWAELSVFPFTRLYVSVHVYLYLQT